jgi:hypothetical protein
MTKQLSTPSYKSRPKIGFVLELFAAGCIIAVAILDSLAGLSLNQDSTTYLEVASRLTKTGHMELLIGMMDYSNPPSPRPYASQPPGFPLLLVPFMAVFQDMMTALVVAQILFVLFFYIAAYWITVRLQLTPLLRLVTLILLTFVGPFLMFHRRFSTETLFMATSIAAALVALELYKGTQSWKTWVLFCGLVALSSTIRYNGVANLAMIAPLVLRKDTIKAAGRLVSHPIVHRGAIYAGGALIILAFASDLRPGAKSGIGHWQWIGILLGALGVASGVLGLLLTKAGLLKKNSTATNVSGESEVSVWPLLTVLVCFVPTLLWFVRNRILFGSVSPANGLFGTFRFDRLWDPINYVWNELLNVNPLLRPFLALMIILLLVLPFLIPARFGLRAFRKTSQTILVYAAVGQLALIWFLSLVTNIQQVGVRFFVPILAFIILGMVNGVQSLIELPGLRRWAIPLSAAPLIFLVLAGSFSPLVFIQTLGKINYPVEKQLWSEINQLGWTHTSSYFYSDYAYAAGGYIHQLFSNRPQGVIWDPKVLQNPKTVRQMLSAGVNPFILVTESGDDARMLDDLMAGGSLPMQKIDFTDTGFILYYLKK